MLEQDLSPDETIPSSWIKGPVEEELQIWRGIAKPHEFGARLPVNFSSGASDQLEQSCKAQRSHAMPTRITICFYTWCPQQIHVSPEWIEGDNVSAPLWLLQVSPRIPRLAYCIM